MIKTIVHVTQYFNGNANPYGDFDAPTSETLTLDELGALDDNQLQKLMRENKTISSYQTYEVLSCEHNGHALTSEPINFSVKTVFASEVKKIKDVKYLAEIKPNGKEIWKPYTNIAPDLDPESYLITVEDAAACILSDKEEYGLKVLDRKTGKCLLDVTPN